jgi:hypothetical protein
LENSVLSRFLASAVVPAIALPTLAFGPGHHAPAEPGFGIARAVHLVTSAVTSITTSPAFATHRTAVRVHRAKARGAVTADRYVVIDCRGNGVVRPGSLELACADANDSLGKLSWTVWSPNFATATGIQTLNDCTPSCAVGKFHTYPVRVILWNSAAVRGHAAERRYTMITLLYSGQTPTVSNGASKIAGPPSVTGNLWS